MIRLRTSQVELTSQDVAYTIRRIILQRRAIRAAESAAALALQNARIKGLLSKLPDELPVSLPQRSGYDSRDESIVGEEPVIGGHREFWRKVVAEAGATDDAASEDGDGAAGPAAYAQGESKLADRSSLLPCRPGGEDDVKHGASYYQNRGRDPRADDFRQKGQGGRLDGAGGGSEFCSPSISVSSFGWPRRDVGGGGRGDGDGSDEEPSSSEFEEDVPSDSELSPRMSQLGDSGQSQRRVKLASAEEEASLFALHRSFSAQLSFDGASESLYHSSRPQPSLLSPPIRASDSQLPSPLSGSVNTQTRLHSALRRSPPRVAQFSSPRSGEPAMGLPIWRNSDYEAPTPQRARRYRPRTSTYSFEESEPTSSRGNTEAQDRNTQITQTTSGDAVVQTSDDVAPLTTDNGAPEGDGQSLRQPSVASGPAQLPDTATVLSSSDTSRSSERRGSDRSSAVFVHQSPIITVPPPSPIPPTIGASERLSDPVTSTQRIQVYNDNRHRRNGRPPAPATRSSSATAHAVARLLRASGVTLPDFLENPVENTAETEGEQRGSWAHRSAQGIAQRNFDEWMGSNGQNGHRHQRTRRESETSEES
ncbi:hypothetical protein GP486_002955 [Trichoglossum hirsutum]|uniref:Uncharacterized protein n=1 Tax=Trichoglossum hirsutum TaxID=265104 RepID=A0A9P8LE41_9PEZI|nr:hypothetical protein GP486_002955 [Trichoglossum hirsutum]